ncbi:MAG: hypothetical protein NZM11_13065, partial [Anaerolineales bacterium]|nr:hypothetical protein [Anaerolineales bacterium]
MLEGLLEWLQQLPPTYWLIAGGASAALTLLLAWWVKQSERLRGWVLLWGVLSLAILFFSLFVYTDSLSSLGNLLVIAGLALAASAAGVAAYSQVLQSLTKGKTAAQAPKLTTVPRFGVENFVPRGP